MALKFYYGPKVIAAKEMQRIEKASIEAGANDESYMKQAAYGIAAEAMAFAERLERKKEVSLLIGKGNNGGDALAVGCYLLDKGFKVLVHLSCSLEETSPLSQKFGTRLFEKGGELRPKLTDRGIILDGLFGTGFSGEPTDRFRELIEAANHSLSPIIAIDIPSGVNGNTGETGSLCIHATHTVYLGLPKVGFFLGEGYNHIGTLSAVDFGMDPKYLEQASECGYLLNEQEVSKLKPIIKRNRHKYQAGYAITVGGSTGMSGAPVMTATGALRCGAGMSRLFYPKHIQGEIATYPIEVIKTPWEGEEIAEILEEADRAGVAIIGPGLGRKKGTGALLDRLLAALSIPLVLDADALHYLSTLSDYRFSRPVMLTPHHGEMLKLLKRAKPYENPRDLVTATQQYAKEKNCTVVLKGAPTWIFHQNLQPVIICRGDPGMATAGSGDVLAGMLGGLVAQGLEMHEAAVFGVYLHAVAGEFAAKARTSYCLLASDLLQFMPKAFSSL